MRGPDGLPYRRNYVADSVISVTELRRSAWKSPSEARALVKAIIAQRIEGNRCIEDELPAEEDVG